MRAKNEKYLIVGQGLAGTLLAYFLLKKNQDVRVIDKQLPGASSVAAAGVMNPVTGRRMVKSWRFDELSKFAGQTYREIENLLGGAFWYPKNILRALPTVLEENEWMRRSAFPENKGYFRENTDLGKYTGKVYPTHGWGEITGSARVGMPGLVQLFRRFLIGKKCFFEEVFDFEKISFEDGKVKYGALLFDKIVFCEGAGLVSNPYFKYLPLVPTKGELLLVKIPGAYFEKMLKNHLYIVPLEDGTYWVGATNHFEFKDAAPSFSDKSYLKNKLGRILKVPFEVIAHKAAIRPTVSDKRPLLGQHPKHGNLFVFNGLGTKGASMGPLFAEQMSAFLLGEKELDKEVDIGRFGH